MSQVIWEYHVETMHADSLRIHRALNTRGDQGWELVAILPVPAAPATEFSWLAIMKRAKHK